MPSNQKHHYSMFASVFAFFSILFAFSTIFYSQDEKRASGRQRVRIPEISAEKVEKMIDVGGRKLHCCVYGKGSPTVVLVSGFGAPQIYWNSVIPALAALTTVVTYDRAGYGESELGDVPCDGKQTAKELHILLEKLDVPKNYILIGHSYGGRIVRLFASMYPEDMGGLILEDTSYEDIRIHMRKILKGKELEFFESVEARPPPSEESLKSELECMNITWEQLQQIERLPHIPLTVLTAGNRPPYRGFSKETGEKLWKIRMEGQRKLSELIPGGKHIIVEGVGHGMHTEKPEVLIDAVTEMVNGIRKKSYPRL